MTPSSIENCAKQLKENDPNLIRLDLSESKLDDSAILETLVAGFEKNIVLRALDLHGNAFGDGGFQVRMGTDQYSSYQLNYLRYMFPSKFNLT